MPTAPVTVVVGKLQDPDLDGTAGGIISNGCSEEVYEYILQYLFGLAFVAKNFHSYSKYEPPIALIEHGDSVCIFVA